MTTGGGQVGGEGGEGGWLQHYGLGGRNGPGFSSQSACRIFHAVVLPFHSFVRTILTNAPKMPT